MASHLPAHLQIFTPDQAPNQDSKFHLFLQLAKELRQKVWMHALERPRIIHLTLHDPIYSPAKHDKVEGSTEFPQNGESFWAITDGYQTMSKLFRVNRDSREAALSFYRVHFPCRLRTIEGVVKWGIIYFNPEHDFLRIEPGWSVKHTLFNFLYHLKTTYDPYGIGLLNLVVEGNDLIVNIQDPSDPELDGGPKMAFTEIMKNLRQVIFYSTIRAGRQILPLWTGVFTKEIIYNRSFPIKAEVPIFDRLARDPRAISEDLKRVFIGLSDYRDYIQLWYQLLKKWDILNPKIQYKWHIAFEPEQDMQVFDRTSANKFMQIEENRWHGIWEPKGPFQNIDFKLPIGAESERYKNEDLETAVKPAFGFWLFPIDVLGPMEEDGSFERDDTRMKVFWDFSKSWPELWVASLPERV